MKLLDGKTAIITGAASPRGLGKAAALLFARHGCRVAILDLDAAAAAQAASDLPGDGHLGRVCDVTDKAACDTVTADLIAALGQIDILVNNAGITEPLRLMDIAPQNYDAVLDF